METGKQREDFRISQKIKACTEKESQADTSSRSLPDRSRGQSSLGRDQGSMWLRHLCSIRAWGKEEGLQEAPKQGEIS